MLEAKEVEKSSKDDNKVAEKQGREIDRVFGGFLNRVGGGRHGGFSGRERGLGEIEHFGTVR